MDEQSIVRGALKQAAGEVRDKWLAEACGDDTALRARVEELLAERELELRVDAAAPESIVDQITGKPTSEPAASPETDPERASEEDAVPGNTTHSVL